jgi:uncharacterized protein YggL (DUF469 family)
MSAPCPLLGFTVGLRLQQSTHDARAAELVADLLRLLDRHGLTAGGGGHRVMEYVVTREGSQATEPDRELVTDWASAWATLAEIAVGPLTDLSEGD